MNCVVIDSTDDLDGMARNLAMSLSLYSGQMCTTPQNLFVPQGRHPRGRRAVPFDNVVGALVKALDGLLGDPARAAGVLGAIATDATLRASRRRTRSPASCARARS